MKRDPMPDTQELQRRAHALIPGGCHTYAKGDDQFPEEAPPFIVRGAGCHAWDRDGREFIEYGMGLRARRFALYAEDGIVRQLHVEAPGEFRVSSAEAMLAAIQA